MRFMMKDFEHKSRGRDPRIVNTTNRKHVLYLKLLPNTDSNANKINQT